MARRRRFEVEKIEGKVTVQRGMLDKHGVLSMKETEEDGGYMVYFPAGHSIRVKDIDELKRLGFHRQPGLVDDETLESIEEDTGENGSLKAHSESKVAGKEARNKFRKD